MDKRWQRNKFYKTRLCPYHFKKGSTCKEGAYCSYAHSFHELRPSVDLTKTKLCNDYLSGNCPRKIEHCPFAHGPKDLRHPIIPSAMGFGAIEAEDFCEQELSQFIEQQLLAGTAGECGYGGELGMYNKGGARELGPRELGVREPPNGRGELLSTSREFIPQQPRTEYIDQRDICRQGLAPTRLSDSSEIPRIRPPRDLQRDTGAAPAELREAVDEALELLRLMTLNDRSPKSADSTADTTEYVPPTDYVPAPF